jgi:hypothetical protein
MTAVQTQPVEIPAVDAGPGRMTPAEQLGYYLRFTGQWLGKNLPQALIATLSGFALGWAANFVMMAFFYDGYNLENGALPTGQNAAQNAVIVWSLFSSVAFGLFGYYRAVGHQRFFADMQRFPETIGSMFRKDGPRVWTHVMWGLAVSLLAASIVTRWAAVAAGALIAGAALSPLGRILASLIVQLWRAAMRSVMPGRESRAKGAAGLFVGLFISALVMGMGYFVDSPKEKLIIGAVMLVAALALSWRRPKSAAAAAVVLLAGTAAWLLLPGVSLADDGGFQEAGGTLKGWLASGGINGIAHYATFGAWATAAGGGVGFALGSAAGEAPPPQGGWGDEDDDDAEEDDDDGGDGGDGLSAGPDPAPAPDDGTVLGDPGPQVIARGLAEEGAPDPTTEPDSRKPGIDAGGDVMDPVDRWRPTGDPGYAPIDPHALDGLSDEELMNRLKTGDGRSSGTTGNAGDEMAGAPKGPLGDPSDLPTPTVPPENPTAHIVLDDNGQPNVPTWKMTPDQREEYEQAQRAWSDAHDGQRSPDERYPGVPITLDELGNPNIPPDRMTTDQLRQWDDRVAEWNALRNPPIEPPYQPGSEPPPAKPDYGPNDILNQPLGEDPPPAKPHYGKNDILNQPLGEDAPPPKPPAAPITDGPAVPQTQDKDQSPEAQAGRDAANKPDLTPRDKDQSPEAQAGRDEANKPYGPNDILNQPRRGQQALWAQRHPEPAAGRGPAEGPGRPDHRRAGPADPRQGPEPRSPGRPRRGQQAGPFHPRQGPEPRGPGRPRRGQRAAGPADPGQGPELGSPGRA